MPTEKNDIVVQICCDCRDIELDFDKLNNLDEYICGCFRVHKATISIAIVDDEEIKKVNAEFLSSPAGTDVISFDLSDRTEESRVFELVVNADEAARQSKKRGHPVEAELALYITHGLLHNLGFGDSETGRAQKMHETEDDILQQAGFGIIYNNCKINKQKD